MTTYFLNWISTEISCLKTTLSQSCIQVRTWVLEKHVIKDITTSISKCSLRSRLTHRLIILSRKTISILNEWSKLLESSHIVNPTTPSKSLTHQTQNIATHTRILWTRRHKYLLRTRVLLRMCKRSSTKNSRKRILSWISMSKVISRHMNKYSSKKHKLSKEPKRKISCSITSRRDFSRQRICLQYQNFPHDSETKFSKGKKWTTMNILIKCDKYRIGKLRKWSNSCRVTGSKQTKSSRWSIGLES